MSLKGREIVKLDKKDLVSDLNKALAAEALASYRYLYYSKVASGINSLSIAEMFSEMSEGEWGHVKRFMQRILQLGGNPIVNPSDWEKTSFAGLDKPGKNTSDLRTMIREALKIERAAIDFYNKLAAKTREADMVTHELAEDVLQEEVEEEQKLANLL